VTPEGSTHVDTAFTGTTSSFSRTASGKLAVVAAVRQQVFAEARLASTRNGSRRTVAAPGNAGPTCNETIRVTPDGEVSIRLPAPLAHHANAEHGRYVLASKVAFAHRGEEWRDRIEANQAVAYRIHYDVERGRWYLTASWQRPAVRTVPLETARAEGMIGVDTNADHFAAYRLDACGNPVGDPRRFSYDLS
jgi:hypothetical protein